MPCSYLIDKERKYAELTSFGKVTREEIEQRFNRLLNDPDWAPGYVVLSDYGTADCRQLSSEDMEQLVTLAFQQRSKLGRSKCAFVVSTKFNYALTRMCALKGGENIVEIGCFWSRDEALDWLGCPQEMRTLLAN